MRYLSEQQVELARVSPPEFSSKEKEFLADGTWGANQSAVAVKDMSSSEGGPNEAQQKMLVKVKNKVVNLPGLYAFAFLSDDSAKMQRLTALKRHTIQTILNLEQELRRRLRKRNKSETSEDADQGSD